MATAAARSARFRRLWFPLGWMAAIIIGYVVAHRATAVAIEKAEAAGIAVVGANNTWYTGMLSYYAEMAAARGLVNMIA